MTSDTVIAIDVGGVRIMSGVVTEDGTVRQSHRHPTGADRGPAAVLETILQHAAGLVDAARAEGTIPRAVGVAIPGIVHEDPGIAVRSDPLGFRDLPLGEHLTAQLGLPVTVSRQVRAAGLAEIRFGAGQDATAALFVTVGADIAAAHLVAGKLVTGAHGAAGELGHVVIRRNGPPCACGARGCLETVSSTLGIRRRYAELGGGETPTTWIAAAAANGDPLAARVWQESVDALAEGLVTSQSLLDPETIIVGGELAELGDTLFTPLVTAVKERLTVQPVPRVVPAELGDQAGLLGAGLLALG